MVVTRIVILDDHPVVREGLKATLEAEEDFLVVGEGATVREASSLVEQHRPDILLLDVHLDELTFGLGAQIRDEFKATKVLFMTAFDSQGILDQARKTNVCGLVSKLEGGAKIRSVLRSVAAGETYYSQPSASHDSLVKSLIGRSLLIDHPLSPREVDVLCCVAKAKTAKEIATDLHISVKTVDRHKANIMDKLNMRSQIELARYAIRHGFVEP